MRLKQSQDLTVNDSVISYSVVNYIYRSGYQSNCPNWFVLIYSCHYSISSIYRKKEFRHKRQRMNTDYQNAPE